MIVTLTYTELQQCINLHFGKILECMYVDSSTVAVSTPIKVMGFKKNVGLNLHFEKVEGADLYLSYDGKLGIDMLFNRLGYQELSSALYGIKMKLCRVRSGNRYAEYVV